MKGVDSRGLGLGDQMDGGVCSSDAGGPLASLLCLVLGQFAPDGWHSNDELQWRVANHAGAELLPQNEH